MRHNCVSPGRSVIVGLSRPFTVRTASSPMSRCTILPSPICASLRSSTCSRKPPSSGNGSSRPSTMSAPGLCIATLGPGATNLTTGVGNAYLDRSPLLAITCNLPTSQLGRRIQMAIDHHTLFRPITKATLALRECRVASMLAEALEIALSEPPGPVHLDLPEDVALVSATEDVPATPVGRRRHPAPETSLRRAAEILGAARSNR